MGSGESEGVGTWLLSFWTSLWLSGFSLSWPTTKLGNFDLDWGESRDWRGCGSACGGARMGGGGELFHGQG